MSAIALVPFNQCPTIKIGPVYVIVQICIVIRFAANYSWELKLVSNCAFAKLRVASERSNLATVVWTFVGTNIWYTHKEAMGSNPQMYICPVCHYRQDFV